MDPVPFPDVCEVGQDAFVGLIVGNRGSGKTTLLVDLLKSVFKGCFSLIVVAGPTFALQDVSYELDPSVVLLPTFNQSILEVLIEFQKDKNDRNREDGKPLDHALLILDDVGWAQKQGHLSRDLDDLIAQSRHYQISIIELQQKYTLASTMCRSQSDFMIFFAQADNNERRTLKTFVAFGEAWGCDFMSVLDKETEKGRSWLGVRLISGQKYMFNQQGWLPCCARRLGCA